MPDALNEVGVEPQPGPPGSRGNAPLAWLVVVLTAAVAGWLAWTVGGATERMSGVEWPLQPDVPGYGLHGAGPGDWSALDPGWHAWPITSELPLLPVDDRVTFALAVALFTLAAVTMIVRGAGGNGALLLGGGLAGAVAMLAASHPLIWLPQQRLATVVGWSVGMVWLALVAAPKLHRTWRGMLPLVLILALIIEPAGCVLVPAAWVWRRLFWPADVTVLPISRDIIRLIEAAAAILAFAMLILFHVLALLNGRALISPGMFNPLWLGVGVVSVAVLAGVAWSGLMRGRDSWLAVVGGAALLTAGCAVSGWLDVRGSRDTWWWSLLALTLVGLLLARRAADRGVHTRGGGMALAVVLVFGVGLAVDRNVIWPKVIAADGAWFQAREVGESLMHARDGAADYTARMAAYRRVIASGNALMQRYPRRSGGGFNDMPASDRDQRNVPIPAELALPDAVQLLRVYAAVAESELGMIREAARINDGRSGKNLPVRVDLPDGYDVATDVTAPAADAESRMDVEQVAWLRFFVQHAQAFEAAMRHAMRDATRLPDGWRLHHDPTVLQRQLIVMAATLLADAPAGEADEALLAVCSNIARLAFGDEAKLPAVGAIERATLWPWLAEQLDGALATTPEPGLSADVARIFWLAGQEQPALDLLAQRDSPPGRRDAADMQLLSAQILFDRFNRLLATATSASDEQAAFAAWKESRSELESLLATPPRARRVYLDALRLRALQDHFGPAESEAQRQSDALTGYERLFRRENPPTRIPRNTAAESETQRDFDIVPCSGEPDVRFLAGTLFLARNDIKSATEAFADELQRDPHHTLAKYQLGRLQYVAARAQYELLIEDYKENYRALPAGSQLPEVETLPRVPLWALERAFHSNDGFARRVDRVTKLVLLAWTTDPGSPDIRELWSTINYFRGDAFRALDQIDLAEHYLREAYTAWPENPEDINGVKIGDKLGHFYAEVWKQLVFDPNEKEEEVYGLLSRALKISAYVRDQLYTFVKDVIADNPDWTDRRKHPFYSIAGDLYPDWYPARHWLAGYHQRLAMLTPALVEQVRKERGIVVNTAEEWRTAEGHQIATMESLAKQKPGSDEWATVLLELAQFYVKWAGVLQSEARALPAGTTEREIAAAKAHKRELLQTAHDQLQTARERVSEFLRFSNVMREVGIQTDAIVTHELYRVTAMLQPKSEASRKLLTEAINAYMVSLEPQSKDANMGALRSLMTQLIWRLERENAPLEDLTTWIDSYEKWVPDPSPLVLGLRRQIEAAAEYRKTIQPLIDAGKLKEALEAAEGALARAPQHSGLEMVCGDLAEKLGDTNAALAYYRLAAEEQTIANWHAARLWLQRTDGKAAAAGLLREFVRRATADLPKLEGSNEIDPDAVDAALVQALNEARTALQAINDEATTLADAARESQNAGNSADAVVKMKAALALDREQPEWRFTLGEALEATGKLDDAETQYAAAAGSGHLLALHNLAMIWTKDVTRLGGAMDALQEFRAAVKSRLDAGEHVDARAKAVYRSGMAERTERELMELARKAAATGLLAMRENRWADAVPELERALYTDPSCAGTLSGYGPLLTTLWQLGRLPELVTWAQRAIERDPVDEQQPAYYLILGRALFALQQPLPDLPALAPFDDPMALQAEWAKTTLEALRIRWPDSAEALRARDILEQHAHH